MGPTVSSTELAEIVGPTQSASSLEHTCHELGLSAAALSQYECELVLTHLGKAPGLEGMAARFAQPQLALLFANKMTEPAMTKSSRRLDVTREERVSGQHRAAVRLREERINLTRRVSSSRLASMFSAGVPREAAVEALHKAAAEIGAADEEQLTLTQVEQVLDAIADMGPGWKSQVQLVRTRMRTGSSF